LPIPGLPGDPMRAMKKSRLSSMPTPTAMLMLVALVMGATLLLACTKQQAQSAESIAVDLTTAVCSPADPLDSNPIVSVVCTIAETAEGVASTVTSLTIKMPKEQVPGFVAAHSAATLEARRARSLR